MLLGLGGALIGGMVVQLAPLGCELLGRAEGEFNPEQVTGEHTGDGYAGDEKPKGNRLPV